MDNLIKDLRINLEKYNFATLKDKLAGFKIDNENVPLFQELIEVLGSDPRKNVISLSEKLNRQLQKFLNEKDRVASMYLFDKSFGDYSYVAGVDEVGRGPLAGPIVAAAVVLDLNSLNDIILEINDSKKLSEMKREELAKIIKEKAVDYSISLCDNKEIDERGIAVCNNEIFIKAINGLTKVTPQLVLSDGYPIRNISILNKFVIKGDTKSASIACASIIAKVYRDNIMKEYAKKYPEYDFENNVGYGTGKHVNAIKNVGVTEIHRLSFLKNIL